MCDFSAGVSETGNGEEKTVVVFDIGLALTSNFNATDVVVVFSFQQNYFL